jgi:hypothetical protein
VRFLVLACLPVFVNSAFSQDSTLTRTFGNIELNIHTRAGLGALKPACLLGGKPLIKKLSVWFTALSGSGRDTLVLGDDVFGQNSSWCEGPAAISGDLRLKRHEWPGLWQVDRLEIVNHRKNFMQTGYKIPGGIALWPGTFVKTGFPTLLAPYADANLDGLYKPQDGDFPYLPGESNVWSMVSDSAGKTPLYLKNGINVDMSSLWFGIASNDSTIKSTAMNRLTLCNRSVTGIVQGRLSLAADFMVGDATDDYMATDVGNKALLALNADANDAVFGINPPAVAVGWLSPKVAAGIRFEQGNDAVQGAQEQASHFFNLAAGKWKTGNPLGFGGRGLDAADRKAQFIYPGNTDITAPRNWSESGEGNNPGRRTGLISTDTFSLKGGKCRVFDAYLTVLESPGDEKNRSESLKKVHDVYAAQDFTLFAKASLKPKTKGMVFPNPAARNEPVFVNMEPQSRVWIYDSRGKCSERITGPRGEIEFEAAGVYMLRTLAGSASILIVY